MRKIIIFAITFIVMSQLQAHAEAKPIKKLARGLVNVVSAPLEIPKQARAYWIEGAQVTDHIIVWVICGIGKGIVEDTKRFTSGVWDIVSFPLAIPADYEPLVKPAYVFEEWPSDPDVFIFKRKN